MGRTDSASRLIAASPDRVHAALVADDRAAGMHSSLANLAAYLARPPRAN